MNRNRQCPVEPKAVSTLTIPEYTGLTISGNTFSMPGRNNAAQKNASISRLASLDGKFIETEKAI